MQEQIKAELKKKLNPKNVSKRPDNGMEYIEGWFAEEEANRIFDFEWSCEIIELKQNCEPTTNRNDNFVVSFRCIVRVTAGGVIHDGAGFGSGIAKDIHTAYEGAIKEAETDAEKRALKKFGYPFGLALYDKSRANVGVELTEEEKKAAAVRDNIKKNITALQSLTTPEAVSKFVQDNPIPGLSVEQAKFYDGKIKEHTAKLKEPA